MVMVLPRGQKKNSGDVIRLRWSMMTIMMMAASKVIKKSLKFYLLQCLSNLGNKPSLWRINYLVELDLSVEMSLGFEWLQIWSALVKLNAIVFQLELVLDIFFRNHTLALVGKSRLDAPKNRRQFFVCDLPTKLWGTSAMGSYSSFVLRSWREIMPLKQYGTTLTPTLQ